MNSPNELPETKGDTTTCKVEPSDVAINNPAQDFSLDPPAESNSCDQPCIPLPPQLIPLLPPHIIEASRLIPMEVYSDVSGLLRIASSIASGGPDESLADVNLLIRLRNMGAPHPDISELLFVLFELGE